MTAAKPTGDGDDRGSTGIEGLDDVLGGGFAGSTALVQGSPGAGKTTVALQFLLAGAARGESGLLISLSETEHELRAAACSDGRSLNLIHVHDVSALEQVASLDFQQSVFQPAEVELAETTRKLLAMVEKIKPARVVFDPITELRLIAGDPIRYRRQIFALKQAFTSYGSTVLLIEDRVDLAQSAASLVHSVTNWTRQPWVSAGTGAGCACRRSAAVHSGKAFMTSRSRPAACCVYPALVTAEHGAGSSHGRSRAAFQRSTACSAVAWTKARARS